MAQKKLMAGVAFTKQDGKHLEGMLTELYDAEALAGVTASVAEVNTNDGLAGTVTTTATPATGTCGVQFVFKDLAAGSITAVRAGLGYISTAAGVPTTAITSVAALTNGTVDTLITGKVFMWSCSAAGLLGMTLTGNADDYYVTFVRPDGRVITSTVCTIN
jgi:hypothetical protein